jgi:thiol-disulfide isomerase/thioredoxin
MKKEVLLLATLWFLFNSKGYSKCGSGLREPSQVSSVSNISGHINGLEKSDSITLRIWPVIIAKDSKEYTEFEEMKIINDNGSFSFNVKTIKKPCYFSLYIPSKKNAGPLLTPILELYLLEPGDNVNISYEKNEIKFSGTGSLKFNCIYNLERLRPIINQNEQSLIKPLPLSSVTDQVFGIKSIVKNFEEHDVILKLRLDSLEKYKSNLSKEAYSLIKSEVIIEDWISKLRLFSGEYKYLASLIANPSISKGDIILIDSELIKYKNYYTKIFGSISETQYKIEHFNIASKRLPELIVRKEQCDSSYLQRKYSTSIYEALKRKYKGYLRDKVICFYFFNVYGRSKSFENDLEDALTIVTDKNCRKILNDFISRKNGTSAYAFTDLEDINGLKHSFSDFRGKVIFIDFFFSSCGGCRIFYQNQVRNAELHFQNDSDVVFLTISVDKDKNRWNDGIKSGKYTSDSLKNVINLYTNGFGPDHPIIEYYKIWAYPHPILIDRKGLIRADCTEDLLHNLTAAITEVLQK